MVFPEHSHSHTLYARKEIRAYYSDDFIRVYQAYSDEIANSALQHQTFVSPPFKMSRMTWIKPSFLWMMYRAGWGKKDLRQKRILAIDICREGFEQALSMGCLSSYDPNIFRTKEDWKNEKSLNPVRIQWDPERDVYLNKLDYKTIQIGLSNNAVNLYVTDWIRNIQEITELANDIKNYIDAEAYQKIKTLLPVETIYPIPKHLETRLGMTT